jgi:hypothetical protein
VLRQVCELMLRDEIPHLRFHADRVVIGQRGWRPVRRALWTAQFRLLFRAVVTAAWIDHRSALLALGVSRRLFTTEARSEARTWLARRGEVAQPGAIRTAVSSRAGRTGRRSSRPSWPPPG